MSIDRSTISDIGTLALLEVGDAILAEMRASKRPAASGAPSSGRATGGTGGGNGAIVKFGRDKGRALSEVPDLSWYRDAMQRNVDDPSKASWRDRNESDLAAIDAEIARRNGTIDTQAGDGFPDGPPPDEDAPF